MNPGRFTAPLATPVALVVCPNTDGHRQTYAAVLTLWLKRNGFRVVLAVGHGSGGDSAFVTSVLGDASNAADTTVLLEGDFTGMGKTGELTETVAALEESWLPSWTLLPTGDEMRRRLSGLGGLQKPKGTRRAGFFIYTNYMYPQDLQGLTLVGKARAWRNRWHVARSESRFFARTLWEDLGLDVAFSTNEDFVRTTERFVLLPEIYRAWGLEIHGRLPEIGRLADQYAAFLRRNEGRTPLVYYGIWQARRGFRELVRLAREDAKYALAFCGRPAVSDSLEEECDADLAALREEGRLFDARIPFLPENELVDRLFSSCRFVVLPYTDFYGVSGSLVQAASYGRPCVVPDTGWMAGQVQRYGLGEVYRHKSYDSMRNCVSSIAEKSESFVDPCRAYASRYTFDALERVLSKTLLFHQAARDPCPRSRGACEPAG